MGCTYKFVDNQLNLQFHRHHDRWSGIREHLVECLHHPMHFFFLAKQTDHGPRSLNSISQKRLEDCLKVGMRLVIRVYEVDFGAIDMDVIFTLAHLKI